MNVNFEEVKKQLEIIKLNEEIELMQAEKESIISNAIANSDKNQAETAKLQAETAKINKQTKLYPYVVAGSFGGAIVGLIGLIIKFF